MDRIAYADGREVKLSYNPLRQLVKKEDWLGITKIENDAAGRALKVQYPDGKEVSYTYGKSGERTGITYPDGRKAEYLYDEEVRLSGPDDRNGMICYRYDEAGRLSRKTFPNGMETSYLYNTSGYLAELAHRDKEGILDPYTYQYDLTGNKTAIGNLSLITADGALKNIYTYGAINRLEQAVNRKGEAASYTYNGLGHRVGKGRAGDEDTVHHRPDKELL